MPQSSITVSAVKYTGEVLTLVGDDLPIRRLRAAEWMMQQRLAGARQVSIRIGDRKPIKIGS